MNDIVSLFVAQLRRKRVIDCVHTQKFLVTKLDGKWHIFNYSPRTQLESEQRNFLATLVRSFREDLFQVPVFQTGKQDRVLCISVYYDADFSETRSGFEQIYVSSHVTHLHATCGGFRVC